MMGQRAHRGLRPTMWRQGRRAIQGLVALVVAVVPFVVTMPSAFAGVGFGVTPTFPPNVTVGQTGLPASLQISNTSTPPESAGNVTITGINLVPACGTTFPVAGGDCPAAQADPGVFQLGAIGTGEAGTACAGQTFAISIIDASTGQVTFTPTGGPVVLTPPATTNSICRIDFTFDVLKAPTKPAGASPPNTVQTAQIGFATGVSAVNGASGFGAGASFVTVAKAAAGITTTATTTGKVGTTPITDTATLTAPSPPGVPPTGTITFTLFGPNNATCTGAAAFTSIVTVNAGVGSYTSAPFSPTLPGTYRWVAAYSGDANYLAATTACGDAGETSTVTQATPAIATTASAPTTIGGTISDSAVLSGGFNPTGTIVFSAFGPNNATCTGTAAFTSTVTVNAGNGTYSSGPFTPTAPGSYNWVAAYSGDASNAPVTSACGSMGETSTVNKAQPAIVTTASGTVTVGGTISDSAVLSGGQAPTGSITFNVFGPNDATCAGTVAFTSTTTVAGDGTYNSSTFTTTAAGTYQFVAVYSGDANNNSVTSACGAANESVVVTKATPAIVTTASPSVPAGGTISDTATLSGGVAPTGTITFTLFGPNNATCTGTAIFTSTVPVNNGNNVYASGPFTVPTPGTYNWVAVYSGDANNSSVTSSCGAANESVIVTKANPAIVTHASASVPAGNPITDVATLSAGAAPTGTIVFTVFGPNNATCAGTAAFTSTVTVNGNGNYTSAPFTPPTAGTFNFIAAYSGDANNNAATTACGDANESVTVTKATPAIVTQASAPVAAGNPIHDTATLSNGVAPTGTITFTLFGPNNATCSGTAIFTSTVPVNAGNGNYVSGSFTANTAGTFRWIAAYSGDGSNNAVTTACGDANEAVVVSPATPKIVTNASANVTVGQTISDTATLSNGVNPTGTITFTVFGPNDATCANAPAFTSVTAVTAGNGTYSSGTFTTTAAGTYRFVAAYSGDANNAAVTTLCNDPNESVVVAQAAPALVTTASASVPVGGTISDTATLSGGVNPTGTITFELFGPNNATCSGTAIFTTTKAVTGNGNYTSAPFTITAPGTYAFEASYSGDTNNTAIPLTACNAAGETVTVTKAAPAIVTVASGSVAAGGVISDTASLSNGVNPTGSITFTLFGPNNAGCTGVAIFTSTKTVNAGNGNYTSDPFTTSVVGTFRWVAAYSGDANNSAVTTGCNDANESVVVTPAVPAIVTHASATVTAGGTIADTATLSGGINPTGTITFTLFGPNNATCSGAAIFTSTKTVAGNADYTSASFTATAAGTYQWVAVYSGDANNAGATSACGSANESVVVTRAAPAIVTTASAPITVGGSITDTAALSNGANPTGTITFTVFGPNDATCATAPAFTSTAAVNGNGSYTSGPFTVTLAGTYRFIAAYSGDGNNTAVTTACNDANEAVVVGKAPPGIVTVASGSVAAGGAITDTATLSGGVGPMGTITFTLFGPNNATCAGTAIFSSTVAVNGNGNYTSAPFTTVLAGTYRWIAAYSGDTNNNAATTACNDANESVVVNKAGPAIATQASGPVTLGGTISDTAALSGGTGPTGTITFTVFGPNNAVCSGTPAFTSTVTVAGNGTYASGNFTPTAPGTYRFVATYSGDANNSAAGPTSCSDPAEAVVVSAGNPTIVTHASAPVTVGGTITDTATLAGGVAPTGTITFQVFGPNNITCSGVPAFTSTKTVAGNGNYTSDPFTVPAAGSYRFVATYSGDANNSPAGPTSCADANEVSAGNKASPAIATTASAPVAVGAAINDTAILTGGFNPTGSITFNLFGPNNTTCTGTPAFTSTVPVNGTGNYSSGNFTPTGPGNFTFVATYSGDTNNNAAGPTACNDPAETVVVSPAATNIATTASPSADIGQPIFDTATLGGSGHPTGTITFTLFGPNNATCTGTPAFTSTKTVNGTGSYVSDSFIPTAAGTYEFVAVYSGDANNAAAGPTPCNDPAEAVVVLPLPQIAVTKSANPLTRPEPGGNFTFTVTVSNPSAVDPVKITSLFDNIYGDLSTRPGSTCGTLIGFTLAPGATSPPCSFTGAFTGHGGDSQTDTVTVTGVDSHGVTVAATAQATVTLTTVLPSISVTKVANPLSLPEPGGIFTFTVQVTNNNTIDPITITTLVDNIYGNLATRAGSTCGSLIGLTLAPGASSPPCSFTGAFNGKGGDSQTDTVTVTGVDSHGNTATATAHATVTLTSLTPVIAVTKAANPLTRPAPGGTFTFTVQVSNPSATDPIKITSLVDNIYGDLATRAGSTCGTLIGITLAPGGVSPPCTFTGAFTGVGGATQTDIVTVTGVDSFGNTATATATATVALTPLAPTAIVTNASPAVGVGGSITDTATLSGGVNATGTITFTLFGPNNATCAGTAIFTSTKTVAGNGNYTSDSFVAIAAGTYQWVAVYSGDATNAGATSACGSANESVVVAKAPPVIVTQVSAAVNLSAAISDTASLTGGFNPTGSITFSLFGPNNATCTGTPAFTATVLVNGNGTYSSGNFTPTAPGSYTFVATYSGDTNNNAAGPTACNDPKETVSVTPIAVSLSTTASPSADVGQPIFDTASLGGSGHPTGTITFSLFGPNNPTCAGTAVFTSTKPVNGAGTYVSDSFIPTAAGTYEFVATYSGDATNAAAGPTPCNDPAESVIVLPRPQIAVTKSPSPASRPEPGGNFTFTVTVSNPSTVDPVMITSLFDNIYGDLSTRPGSTCGTLIGVTLAPGATSPPCSFIGPFTGHGGDSQTDTVTVTGVDSHGVIVAATAQATVTLTAVLPTIAVTKSPSPASLPEPGGTFTFTVVVSNPSTVDPVTITTLTDNIYGDLSTRPGSTCGALIGTTLAPGASSSPCTFTGVFNGRGGDHQTDIVTVTGTDTGGHTVSATAQATVVLTSLTPQIAVTKVATPLTEPAPGGTFTFTVVVSNPSNVDPVKITSLVDNIYGDLATRPGSTCGTLIGTTLAPGGVSAPCSFTGPFTGTSGASQTDIVTVSGVDSFGNHVTNTAQATVTLTPAVPPQIKVTKSPNPSSRPAPGGTFTFTVQVSNPSTTVAVKITQLVDNVYGDLSTLPGSTCGSLIGTTLAPGAVSAPCTFTGPFTGKAGDSQTDTVTVTGVGSNGIQVTATAQATVTLTALTPIIAVTKAANPLSLPQPGGLFTFTVTVSNPGPDPVKITSVVDNVYGDLATRAGSTCGALIGVTLAPGATAPACSFTGSFTGAGGGTQTDIVTVAGTGSTGIPVTATARATVGITAAPSQPLALTGFNDRRVLALAGSLILLGLMLLTGSWLRRRYDS